jgi:hypothetical protein
MYGDGIHKSAPMFAKPDFVNSLQVMLKILFRALGQTKNNQLRIAATGQILVIRRL